MYSDIRYSAIRLSCENLEKLGLSATVKDLKRLSFLLLKMAHPDRSTSKKANSNADELTNMRRSFNAMEDQQVCQGSTMVQKLSRIARGVVTYGAAQALKTRADYQKKAIKSVTL